MREGGYTIAGSGKSQARHLFGVIVYGVMAAFVIAAWKGKEPNTSWAAIISALTVPLGGAWVFGKLRKPVGAAAPSAPGAPSLPTPDPRPGGGTP